MRNILVIKHGALGDIILATAAFAAIRSHFPDAHITALTTAGYRDILAQSPYFNEVRVDSKPRPWNILSILRLRNMLNAGRYDAVIDLQCSSRSSSYWWLFTSPKPIFCGVARFASHRYHDAARHSLHAYENLQKQLALLNIAVSSRPSLAWLEVDITTIKPAKNYALLVPGGAAHRPEKRWPYYASLAASCVAAGITPVLLGGNAEAEILTAIADEIPAAHNLCGKTSLAHIATLARSAAFAIGNDTGPMHVIAASGCPSLVLFSSASDPKRSAPLDAHVLQRQHLAELTREEVILAASRLDSAGAKALA